MIWIGTQGGLVRWDGYRSRIFRNDPQDPLSLPDNYVTALTVDDEGTLFVATATGIIVRFDPLEENFRPLPAVTTATGTINSSFISAGKDGGLWVGNANGLSNFNPKTQHWEIAPLPTGTKVSSLVLARDGTMWVGTEQGLLRHSLNTTTFTPIEGTAGRFPSVIRVLFESANGDIWFGKNDGTVGRVNGAGEVATVDFFQGDSQVKGITEIKPGVMSIATSAGLIFVDEVSGREIQSFRYDPGRPSGFGGTITSGEFLDRDGGLWVAHERGTDYLAPGTDAFLSLLPSDRDPTAFSGRNVAGVASRPDGTLWLGTDAGVEMVWPGNGPERPTTTQANRAKLLGTLSSSFAFTGPDQAWIGSVRGLYVREKGQIRQIAALGDTPIRSLFAEGNVLWIGTQLRGLVRLDIATNNFTYFSHDPSNPNSISDNWIYQVARDRKGRLWIPTMHGLDLFKDGRFTQFHHDPTDSSSLPNDSVHTLLVDREDRLWIGTQGGGVAILDEAQGGGVKFRAVQMAPEMRRNDVGKLIEDEQGQIWGSTNKGLIRIDPKSLTTRSFTATDGLAISAYWAGSGARAADGSLLFGGVGGLTIVHPNRLTEPDKRPPPIVITGAQFGGRHHSALTPLVLPPEDHNLEVDFAALDYARSEQISVAHKLSGFDKDWTVTDADHRQAIYTNLPPGHYTLLLQPSASKDFAAGAATQIDVTVVPTWNQTWWFKVCVALAALGCVVIFVRSRTALLRRRQKELEGQVVERTAEIASLLHNSGEGFLSFDQTLVIDRQYSRACETFLGEIPAGKNAAALLFAENPRHVAFVTESVPAALAASDNHKKELILSLLPKEIDRRGRRLRLHYTIIENGHLMVVLRDVTTERRLAERVESEHRRLEMIVAAVTDSRDFFDALSAYELFINFELPELPFSESDPALILKESYRAVHTFKGIFNQFSFEKTPALLHELEEQLDILQRAAQVTLADIAAAISPEMLMHGLKQDLTIIRQALGEEFLNKGGQVTMSPTQAARVRELASLWRSGEPFNPTDPKIRLLLDEVDRVGSVSLKAELAAYDQTIAQVARRMEKEVAPLIVTANDEVWLDPDRYGPFLRSLIHVFRNCVAHGIEPPDIRVERGKDEQGLITCSIERTGEDLRIAISDDGGGVDLDALRQRIKKSEKLPPDEIDALTDQEALDFIFRDNISTARLADAFSGRGVGLAAVRQEVERLGGSMSVETELGRGTSFIFWLKQSNLAISSPEWGLLRQSGL